MIEQIQPREQPNYPEILDLREMVRMVLKYKWILIAITLISVIAAYFIRRYTFTPTYTASTYIVVKSEPIFRTVLDSSIQTGSSFPDTESLVELSEAPAIVNQSFSEMGLSAEQQDGSLKLEVFLISPSQLRLEVTSTDPNIAADFANNWTENVSDRINDLFGTGDQTVVSLENEVQNAKDKWDTAQEAVENKLSSSRETTITIQLDATKENLKNNYSKLYQNQLLISDALSVLDQISQYEDDEQLSVGTILSIMALQQKTVGLLYSSEYKTQFVDQFQVLIGDALLQSYTTLEGQENLQLLVDAVQKQNASLESEISSLETNISELSLTLESEVYQLARIVQERDLARSAYTALAGQLEETKISQAQEDQIAKIGAKAMVPEKPNSPRIMIVSGLAGIFGFLLTILGIFIHSWWTVDDEVKRVP
jgi:uncharacterized protein involved in exopolysaccharide biosynthesis